MAKKRSSAPKKGPSHPGSSTARIDRSLKGKKHGVLGVRKKVPKTDRKKLENQEKKTRDIGR